MALVTFGPVIGGTEPIRTPEETGSGGSETSSKAGFGMTYILRFCKGVPCCMRREVVPNARCGVYVWEDVPRRIYVKPVALI